MVLRCIRARYSPITPRAKQLGAGKDRDQGGEEGETGHVFPVDEIADHDEGEDTQAEQERGEADDAGDAQRTGAETP